MSGKWDAEKYTSDFSFVHKYGSDMLKLIGMTDGMTAIDLGCGNGALTKSLNDMGIKTAGLDMSPELLEKARREYPEIEFIEADATDFKLAEKVNLVFSNAVFHWIAAEDQSKMMKCVYDALLPDGQFIFELGGHGNNVLIHAALKAEFEKNGLDYKMPFYFPTVGEYSALLEAAGFKPVFALLFDRPTKLNGENGMADWLNMFIKAPFDGVDDNLKEKIIRGTAAALKPKLYRDGVWYADYVRLRMKAIKEVE